MSNTGTYQGVRTQTEGATFATWKIGGTEFHPDRWRVRMERGEPIDWEFSFLDPDQDYTWFGNVAGLFSIDPYDEFWTLKKYVTVSIRNERGVWTSPKLVHLEITLEVGPEGFQATFSGSDQSEALLTSDEYMSDVRTTQTSVATAHQAVTEIAAKYKISVDQQYEDFPVGILHRVGSPMDWCRELFEVRQAWGLWEGDTWVIQDGGNEMVAADVELSARTNLSLVRFRRSAASVYNEATCIRTSDQINALNEPVVGKGKGIIEITLDNPVCDAYLVVETFPPFGKVDQVAWKAGGVGIAGPGFHYQGTQEIDALSFVLSPLVGAGPNPDDIPYRVMVYGRRANANLNSSIELEYTATYRNEMDQTKRGRRRYKAPVVKPSVPNQGVASDFITRFVRESMMHYTTATFETLLDPTHRLGMTASVTFQKIGLVSYFMLIHALEWADQGEGATESLELMASA